MKTIENMSPREKHLVLLAASIASGCKPCTNYHLAQSREAGITEDDIKKTIGLAVKLRNEATRFMRSVALDKKVKERREAIAADTTREDILIGIAVSFSINYHPGFIRYKEAGRERGIGEEGVNEVVIFSKAVGDKARSLIV